MQIFLKFIKMLLKIVMDFSKTEYFLQRKTASNMSNFVLDIAFYWKIRKFMKSN